MFNKEDKLRMKHVPFGTLTRHGEATASMLLAIFSLAKTKAILSMVLSYEHFFNPGIFHFNNLQTKPFPLHGFPFLRNVSQNVQDQSHNSNYFIAVFNVIDAKLDKKFREWIMPVDNP